MMIHDITAKVGQHKLRMRVGRGEGSGKGGTSGRGHKGAKSRAGWTSRPGYQGGSTPLLRRFPKRGFSNADFRVDYHVINVGDFAKHFAAGANVDIDALVKVGVIRDAKLPLKVLGTGDLGVKLAVTADRFSASAKSKIESAGGTATLTSRGTKTVEDDGRWAEKAKKITARSQARIAETLARIDAKAAAGEAPKAAKKEVKEKGIAKRSTRPESDNA